MRGRLVADVKFGKIIDSRETTRQAVRTIQVIIEEDLSVEAWNEYVLQRGGTLYHRAEWERVFSIYRLPYWRLAAMRSGRVVGVLPLAWQRSLLFGSHFVSIPCFDAAGVLADDHDAARALVEKAVAVADDVGAKVVLFRQAEPYDLSPHVRTDKVLLRMRLPASAEALWAQLKAKVRNQVKKARKEGLVVTHGGSELLPTFSRIYSENMRDLGSPSHSPAFFRKVMESFPNGVAIYVVWRGAEAIGAGFTMRMVSVWRFPLPRVCDAITACARIISCTGKSWKTPAETDIGGSTSDAVPSIQALTASKCSGVPSACSCTGTISLPTLRWPQRRPLCSRAMAGVRGCGDAFRSVSPARWDRGSSPRCPEPRI